MIAMPPCKGRRPVTFALRRVRLSAASAACFEGYWASSLPVAGYETLGSRREFNARDDVSWSTVAWLDGRSWPRLRDAVAAAAAGNVNATRLPHSHSAYLLLRARH